MNQLVQSASDLAAERQRLHDIIRRFEQDEDVSNDPQFPELLALLEAENKMRQQSTLQASRLHAEPQVPFAEATNFRRVGKMINDGDDLMTLHTKHAYRLFLGRARDLENPAAPAIVGGKRAAACLRAVFGLSAQDNPYADWQLLQVDGKLKATMAVLAQISARCDAALEVKRQLGLEYTILRSAEPQKVTLGFSSPYGYQIAELIVVFDKLVRKVRTLARKNVWTDDEARLAIMEATRPARAVFADIVRTERLLNAEVMRPLSRHDFIPDANEAARKRLLAAKQLFGELPKPVLTGQTKPPHTLRNGNLSAEEQALLDSLDTAIPDPEVEEALL